MLHPMRRGFGSRVAGGGAFVLALGVCACRGVKAAPPPRGGVPPAADPPHSEARLVSDSAPIPPGSPPPTAPSPVPSETSGEAKPIDELLAVVEGDVITRSRIAKVIGPRTPEESEATYE